MKFSFLFFAGSIGLAAAQPPSAVPAPMLRALGIQPAILPAVQPLSADTIRPVPGGLVTPKAAPDSVGKHNPEPATPQGEEAVRPRRGIMNGRLMATQGGRTIPVPFASIGLFRTDDSSSVAGGLTDERGYFTLANLPAGTYFALIQSLGYAPKRLPRLSLSAGKPVVDLGTISLTETSRQLDEVVVSAQRQAFEYALDRKIVNVDQLPIAQGGSAIDILQNVPSVVVDIDGGLSLRGSGNVIVLVDGKPSGLAGLDRQAVLDQIPASNIERVEVITNPSSRFDADGAAGIINIILKKEQAKGVNGTIQLNVGTRDKYNGSLNLNARFKKVNLFGSYNFRADRRFQYRLSDRQNRFGSDSVSYLVQRNDAVRRRVNNNLRLGVYYAFSPRDNITVSALYRPEYSYDTELERFDTQNANRASLGQTIRTNEEREPERGLDYAAGYRRTFAREGRLLTADATLSTNRGLERQQFTNTTTLPAALLTPSFLIGQQRATNARDNRVAVLQTDFVEPFKAKQRLEAGLKYTYRRLGADYLFENRVADAWLRNEAISNNFIYNERTTAAYANFGNELKRFSYQAGLRTEYTRIDTDQRTTGQRNTRQYVYLFPSVFVNYALSEGQKMQLNYTRRIDRPSGRSLNPFIDLQDPLNIRFGNPLLNPELINSFELSHLWNGKSTSLTSALFFRQTNNEITRYRTLRPDGITEETSLNLNRSQNYGLELVADQTLTRWWKVTGTATFFQRTIQAGGDIPGILTRTNRSWTARFTNDLRPKRGTAIQLAVNYRSPFLVAQGTISSFFNVDMGVKHEVLQGRGTLSLRVSDIFNTLQYQNDSFGPNFMATTIGKRESRIGFVGFSYRLSRQKPGGRKDDEDDDRRSGNGDEEADF